MVQNGSVSWIFKVATCKSAYARTAVTTSFGLLEFNCMPFGLTNAPVTFQLLMGWCLSGLNLKICLVYLDDTIVFASTFKETLERLQTVVKCFRDFRLKSKASMCKFYYTKLPYLGHVVSALGVSPDPDKIAVLQEWFQHPPKNFHELHTCFGFVGYYCTFGAMVPLIPGFSPEHHCFKPKGDECDTHYLTICQNV